MRLRRLAPRPRRSGPRSRRGPGRVCGWWLSARDVDLLRHEPRARVFFLRSGSVRARHRRGVRRSAAVAYERFDSAWAISLVLLADLVPAMLLGPVFGAAADRWSRRGCMVVADVLRAVAFIGIALVDGFAPRVAAGAAGRRGHRPVHPGRARRAAEPREPGGCRRPPRSTARSRTRLHRRPGDRRRWSSWSAVPRRPARQRRDASRLGRSCSPRSASAQRPARRRRARDAVPASARRARGSRPLPGCSGMRMVLGRLRGRALLRAASSTWPSCRSREDCSARRRRLSPCSCALRARVRRRVADRLARRRARPAQVAATCWACS